MLANLDALSGNCPDVQVVARSLQRQVHVNINAQAFPGKAMAGFLLLRL